MTALLTPRQRLALIDHINRLTQPDFETLVFALDAPASVIPSNFSAQGDRVAALLSWVESPTGCGMDNFLSLLEKIAPFPSELRPFGFPTSVSAGIASPQFISMSKPEREIKLFSLSNEVTLELVHIPSGVFFMGSPEDESDREHWESPQHKVKLPGFYMGKYPVTQEQWHVVSLMESVDISLPPNPSRFRGERRPVEGVSWLEAVEFCNRLSEHAENLDAYMGKSFRLPSEAEWEYACRANTRTLYYFGDTITVGQVNYNESVGGTTPVGNYPSNSFGVYDMHGNVWEGCLDTWHSNYDGAPRNGEAWIDEGNSDYRVVRGGSWSDTPEYCRSASRNLIEPKNQSDGLGFRVVLASR